MVGPAAGPGDHQRFCVPESADDREQLSRAAPPVRTVPGAQLYSAANPTTRGLNLLTWIADGRRSSAS